MIRMIIVEDESFERSSLINCIDWSVIGVEIVGDAANGEAGILLAKQCSPDIILTDINMPVMNAIEMSRELRLLNKNTKIIFISSYNDFEYAKQAIELHIFSYLMKPINENELLRTVKRAVDSITEERLEEKIYSNLKNNYKQDIILIREAILLRVLRGAEVADKELEKANLNWLFYQNNMVLCIFFTTYETMEGTPSLNAKEISEECGSICDNMISACYHKGSMITIASFKQKNAELQLHILENKIREGFEKQNIRIFSIQKEYSQITKQSLADLYNEIYKKEMGIREESQTMKAKKKSKQAIADEIESIINARYRENLTIEDIAKRMHFTPNYIGMIYKNIRKETINQYLTKVRMNIAKKMLLETKLTVNEISYQCGFDNVTYFHTLFKKETGITPNEFRSSDEKTKQL